MKGIFLSIASEMIKGLSPEKRVSFQWAEEPCIQHKITGKSFLCVVRFVLLVFC